MNDYIKREDACRAMRQLQTDDIELYGVEIPECFDANRAIDTLTSLPAADVVERPRWISVEERLPTGGDDSGAICENVCLLLDGGTVSCGWMNGITKKVYYLNARDDVIIKAPITRVTHWMPLPEPPKEVE